MFYVEPGQLSGLRVTKLMSTEAHFKWNRLPCREHNGRAVGYKYKLSRHLRPGRPPVNVMSGIINSTTLDLNDLVPFTNYTVSVQFANHLYQGPRSTLDFITFEDRECLSLF